MYTKDTSEASQLRQDLSYMLGIPQERVDLNSEFRGKFTTNDVTIEKWIWTSEPGSRVTSLLYLPEKYTGKLPGIVITNGHGGSKNSKDSQYAALLYAKLGIACLLHDTIGEEERHVYGGMGTRAHDDEQCVQQADKAGRLILGKMIFDASRAIDFLCHHSEIDSERLGVAGNSLGGTVATWLAALDTRLKVVIISGSGLSQLNSAVCKSCCSVPSVRMHALCDYGQLVSLASPHCAVLLMNGTCDDVVTQGKKDYWQQHNESVRKVAMAYKKDAVPHKFKSWFQPEGGHRSYHLHPDAIAWLSKYLELPQWTSEIIHALPTITAEQWYDKHGLTWPEDSAKLYWVDVHHKGGLNLDMEIAPIPEEQLKCLIADEVGNSEYTLQGWLEQIRSVP